MINITVKGAEVACSAHGRQTQVCTEELSAIVVLRDNLAEHMEFTREKSNYISN